MKNIFFIALGHSSKIIFGFYIFVSAGRLLENKQFAIFTQHLTFFAIISLLSIFGAGNFLVREFSRRKSSDVFGIGLLLNFISSSVFVVIITAGSDFLNKNVFFYDHKIGFFLFFSSVYIINGFNTILSSYFIARSRYKINSIVNVVALFLSIPASYFWIQYEGENAFFYVFSLFSLFLLFSFVLYITFFTKIKLRKIISLRCKIYDLSFLRDVWGFTFPIWVGVLLLPVAGLYIRNEYVAEFGLFNLSLWQMAVKVSELIQQFSGVLLSQLVFPFLIKNKKDNHIFINDLSVKIACIFIFFISIVYFYSEYIFGYFFGYEYIGVAEFLTFYIVGDFFRVVTLLIVYWGLSKGNYEISIFFEILQGLILFLISYLIIGWSEFSISYAYMISYILCYFTIRIGFKFNKKVLK